MWLFVFAIALHNLPEGMAIGVSFSHGDMSVGLPLTTAIVLQDIPEGLAVAMALKAAGFSPWRGADRCRQWFDGAARCAARHPTGQWPGARLPHWARLGGRRHDLCRLSRGHPRNPPQRTSNAGQYRFDGGFALMMLLDTTLG